MSKLQELFRIVAENTAAHFLEHGAVSPMWHAVTADNELLMISTIWDTRETKYAMTDAVRDLFRDKNVQYYVFVAEAWQAVVTDLTRIDEYTDGKLEHHADRREIVALNGADRAGNQVAGEFYIRRPKHGPPTLSILHVAEPDRRSDGGELTGMFR